MGRWSWSSDFWDFDHDGYADLYVANGYLSGPRNDELAGFFWRQVVAKSPEDATAPLGYERGWNAINELIRSDHTWHGHARNVMFANNHDGTFTEASGALALDFREDCRAFALADLDQDGRLEVILKNRNAPQIRVFTTRCETSAQLSRFACVGIKSNRDAIGASITVTRGSCSRRNIFRPVRASSLSTRRSSSLVWAQEGTVQATVRWPSGVSQTFEQLPCRSSHSNRRRGRDISPLSPSAADQPAPGNIEHVEARCTSRRMLQHG